ncbi:hypothetical protein HNP38_001561 [Chryseobacterium defluvii]|uniref:Uncharacterized protein n=1 Tax=Chryseobacterium defluvii TaxID=160396 RepID=A0A840KA94_9FLAO|nr:hypothetical protein [Chryseobacterium defluvii]MBB4806289.1 hypothetical protein [Chryseobacterium defluvii]
MTTFNREQYELAVTEWASSLNNFTTLKTLLPTNYVFDLSLDEITWLKSKNLYKDFCMDMGVYENRVVLILSPLGEDGNRVPVDDYPYSVLMEMQGDLSLVETRQYVVIKNAVLSNDLKKIDDDADMYFPVANKPMLEQDKVVNAIESWRNEGVNWLYYETQEFEGRRIFQRFYVPSENLTPPKPGLNRMVCSFGLKFSDIYQRMLVTLIFISFYDDLSNTGSIETISNTYDWSQPCPPFCQL